MTMNVSVVVPTFNRAARLPALIEDLRGQCVEDLEYEIVIVDNGSTDRTALTVRDHAAHDPRVHYVLERSPGASCARNAGIAAATAPILAFIDDDVRPRRDWVASVYRAFAEEPELDCIGGRIEPRWPVDPPAWLTSAHWGPLALQMGRGSSSHIDREHAAACLVTANFACRASVFRELGGFSPEFRRDKDREFNLRLWRAGKRGKYVDSVVTYTEVQPERMEKSYHRAWHHVTGQSHARMRYRDSITPDGVWMTRWCFEPHVGAFQGFYIARRWRISPPIFENSVPASSIRRSRTNAGCGLEQLLHRTLAPPSSGAAAAAAGIASN